MNYDINNHHRPKFPELFENNKILIKDISGKGNIVCGYDTNSYVDQTIRICIPLHLIGNINNKQINNYIKNKSIILSKSIDLKYIISIISSNIIGFYFNKYLSDDLHISPHQIRSLPIPKISPEDQIPFIEKVDKILEITKQDFYDPKNPPKEQKDLEDEIDKMVYELYGLNEEEVRVVEESLKC